MKIAEGGKDRKPGADHMNMNRRDFIKGASGLGGLGCLFAGGCSCLGLAGDVPQLRFGVVSDVYVRAGAGGVGTAEGYGTETMEKALASFRRRGRAITAKLKACPVG